MSEPESTSGQQPARERIIEATCELLELQGYHATGLKQILGESKCPKGSLYHYFPGGKEELAAHALSEVGETVLERIRASLAEQGPAAKVIPAFIRNIALHVERSGFRAGGPITTVALETASSSDRIRTECTRIYREWQRAFAKRLEGSGPDGSKLRDAGTEGSGPGTPLIDKARARRLSAVIISAIEGAIILSRCERSRLPLEDVAAEIEILLEEHV